MFEKLKKVFSKEGEEKEEFIKLEPEVVRKKAKIRIKYFVLVDYEDSRKIINALRDGNVAFVKIKPLKEKDISELKRVIEKIKRTVEALDGAIVGIDQDWVIAAPGFVEVTKG